MSDKIDFSDRSKDFVAIPTKKRLKRIGELTSEVVPLEDICAELPSIGQFLHKMMQPTCSDLTKKIAQEYFAEEAEKRERSNPVLTSEWIIGNSGFKDST